MNGPGATRATGVTSQADCEAACLAKTFDQCGAYDFDKGASSCWLFTSEPGSLNPATNVDHYKRDKCDASMNLIDLFL